MWIWWWFGRRWSPLQLSLSKHRTGRARLRSDPNWIEFQSTLRKCVRRTTQRDIHIKRLSIHKCITGATRRKGILYYTYLFCGFAILLRWIPGINQSKHMYASRTCVASIGRWHRVPLQCGPPIIEMMPKIPTYEITAIKTQHAATLYIFA